MPEGVVLRVWDAGIEASLDELPAIDGTHRAGELGDIVVGIGVPEGFASGVKQVLPVDKGDSTDEGGFTRHREPRKQKTSRGFAAAQGLFVGITPPGPQGRVA